MMSRLNVSPDHALLLRVLREPQTLCALTPVEFANALDAAEYARLLGWLQFRIEEGLVPTVVPPWLAERLTSTLALVGEYDRAVRWEIDRLDRVFLGTGIRWVLLKGAAYLAAGLPPGRGRNVADIDLLVSAADLPAAERALTAQGWAFPALDPYDERYYREWMHEVPPMVHRERGSIVDLHHAILPRTSRLHPSSERLLEGAIEVAPGIRTLRPSHQILHAAAHLFHDGEIAGAIRDVVDLDGLLRHFGRDPAFWADLVAEAPRLGLARPAFYALRYAQLLFATSVPAEVLAHTSTWAPSSALTVLMDRLVLRALPGEAGRGSSSAALALYIRSHWLRMPPRMLAQHLMRKAWRAA